MQSFEMHHEPWRQDSVISGHHASHAPQDHSDGKRHMAYFGVHMQGFSSTPVRLNLIDLDLDRTAAARLQNVSDAVAQQQSTNGLVDPLLPTHANDTGQLAKPPDDLHHDLKTEPQAAINQEACSGAHESDVASKEMAKERKPGTKPRKKQSAVKAPASSVKVSAATQHSAGLDSSSQLHQPASVPDPALSINSQPQGSDTAVAPEALAKHAAGANLPPSGLHSSKAARAKHKAQAGPQPGPARKKQRTRPADDVMVSGASSHDSLEDIQPAGSNASSCPPQLNPNTSSAKANGAGKAAGKDKRPRKIMSLHAASQDKTLDKSPLQAPVIMSTDADDVAHPDDDHALTQGFRHLPERPSSFALSDAQMDQLTAAPQTLPSDPQPKHEIDYGSAAEPQGEPVPSNHDAQLAPPKQSRRVVANATSKPSVLSKRYGSTFIWAQLSGWFKQTVYDPTASLSAERRGTISLPDIESCYGTARQRYGEKVCTCRLSILHCQCLASWQVPGHALGASIFDAVPDQSALPDASVANVLSDAQNHFVLLDGQRRAQAKWRMSCQMLECQRSINPAGPWAVKLLAKQPLPPELNIGSALSVGVNARQTVTTVHTSALFDADSALPS